MENLKNKKNILAFSGGVDSSALFHMLLDNNIDFDMIHINYNLRSTSKNEMQYAIDLAQKYEKKVFILNEKVKVSDENSLRNIRYHYFSKIYHQYDYENLIIAHQLNDRMEWFLMQLTKGSGLKEMLSMDKVSFYQNMKIVRPMIEMSRDSIYEYLYKNKIIYFEDESNEKETYKRNFFRHHFSNELIQNFQNGIINSFQILDEEKDELSIAEIIENKKELYVLKGHKKALIRKIDKILKTHFNIVLSQNEKNEIRKSAFSCILKNKICIDTVEFNNTEQFKIYICPVIEKEKIDKMNKEKMRVLKIPSKIRNYYFKNFID